MSRHEGPHSDERPGPVVMEILGYSQIALITSTYSRVAPEVSPGGRRLDRPDALADLRRRRRRSPGRW
jgi:hypothetical protein